MLKGKVAFILFDCLYKAGDKFIDNTMDERRKALESLIKESEHIKLSKIYSLDDTQKAIDESIREGGEGIVIKNKDASYIVGKNREMRPSGVQYKLKTKHVDWDVVIFDYSKSYIIPDYDNHTYNIQITFSIAGIEKNVFTLVVPVVLEGG